MLSQKHLQELYIFAKRTFEYNPDEWGDTIEEAVGRVRDGYAVPYPLVKKLVKHAAAMQTAMVLMSSAVEARMADMDARSQLLPNSKIRARNKTKLLTRKPPTREDSTK
jgi:hypothetical protein